MSFKEKLDTAIEQQNSLLCIGLDPVLDKIPSHLHNEQYPLFSFNKDIIDATHDLAVAYKPNSAFFEAYGAEGISQLKMTCDYIREKNPAILIILDAKRGDIGSTNEGYVKYAYEYLQADAITLHPYLGREALGPFLNNPEKGCILLCRTSNPGAGEFQDMHVVGDAHVRPVAFYKYIAEQVSKKWNTNQNCMLVVGATYPKELKEVRSIVGEMPILVPGIGAQGGDLEATLSAGLTEKKSGLIISAGRSIIYSSNGQDFAEKSREEATKLQKAINTQRS